MNKYSFLFTVAANAAVLACMPAAEAGTPLKGSPAPSLVTTGDTFDFDISGYNNAGTVGYLLTPRETTTFGTTQTYTGASYDDQNITVTSSESVGVRTTTDTVTVSTPTSFLMETTVNGYTITQLQLDIGNANAGKNTIDYALPITSYTATGSVANQTSSATLTPTTTLSNNNESVAAAEGISFGAGNPAADYAITSFTYSITYPTVPESSGFGLIGGVVGLLLGVNRLRHRWL